MPTLCKGPLRRPVSDAGSGGLAEWDSASASGKMYWKAGLRSATLLSLGIYSLNESATGSV